MRTGIIYKYTNKAQNGFFYIGQTLSNRKIREGANFSNYSKSIEFKNAISKYGAENFDYEILESDVPEDLLDERERYWISFYHTYVGDPLCHGYNMTVGGNNGEGRVCRAETKEKTSQSLKGHNISDRVRQRMTEYNHERKGLMPKNHETALEAAHKAVSKEIVEIKTGKVFSSKAACAAYYNHAVTWVDLRLRGHKKNAGRKYLLK